MYRADGNLRCRNIRLRSVCGRWIRLERWPFLTDALFIPIRIVRHCKSDEYSSGGVGLEGIICTFCSNKSLIDVNFFGYFFVCSEQDQGGKGESDLYNRVQHDHRVS